jgi:hypothetical protein
LRWRSKSLWLLVTLVEACLDILLNSICQDFSNKLATNSSTSMISMDHILCLVVCSGVHYWAMWPVLEISSGQSGDDERDDNTKKRQSYSKQYDGKQEISRTHWNKIANSIIMPRTLSTRLEILHCISQTGYFILWSTQQ